MNAAPNPGEGEVSEAFVGELTNHQTAMLAFIRALMPGSLPDQQGPRLSDLRPQASEYGRPIPLVYGTVGMSGNVIWASDLIEVSTTTEQGGKGGKFQRTQGNPSDKHVPGH